MNQGELSAVEGLGWPTAKLPEVFKGVVKISHDRSAGDQVRGGTPQKGSMQEGGALIVREVPVEDLRIIDECRREYARGGRPPVNRVNPCDVYPKDLWEQVEVIHPA